MPQACPAIHAASDALARWPHDQPLAVLWSGAPLAPHVVRPPTLLARPSRTRSLPSDATALDAHALLASMGMDRPIDRAHRPPPYPHHTPPWLAWFSYDLGRLFEPTAQSAGQHPGQPAASRDRVSPLAVAHECNAGLWFDPHLDTPTRDGARPFGPPLRLAEEIPPPRAFALGEPTSTTGRAAFEAGVARVLDYIRAGDVYQVNLAHRLSAPFAGCPRALFRALVAGASPWHGFYSELVAGEVAHVVACASPELFLRAEPSSLRTSPMKGTRPAGEAGERELAASAKDRAELAMIVDLMRNDLGRVCELASVRVATPRALEHHGDPRGGGGGLLQTTATIEGVPRTAITLADVLAATFPPGSVTGAPKIRAMQIIDELEPHRRGAYCGAAGLIVPPHAASLAVTIRTACITGRAVVEDGGLIIRDGVLDWWVGAGIVADSDPREEWLETLAKASALRAALQA